MLPPAKSQEYKIKKFFILKEQHREISSTVFVKKERTFLEKKKSKRKSLKQQNLNSKTLKCFYSIPNTKLRKHLA